MAFTETLQRLNDAGLLLNRGITRLPVGAAVISKNVEMYPAATITKRPGYVRFLDVAEAYPVTGLVQIDDQYLVLAGDLDEQTD